MIDLLRPDAETIGAISRMVVRTLIACIAACGAPPAGVRPDPPDASPDGRGAGPDAPIDSALDAPPDVPAIVDEDHDGFPADRDCDDHDPDVWQNLAYTARDADGDGHTVASAGVICSGDQLPRGYLAVVGEPDCDDTDPAVFTQLIGYLDVDGDGHGSSPSVSFCTAGTLPANYAAVGDDCAPADPAHWTELPYAFRDADGDGAVIAEAGTVCSGAALPAGYLAEAPAGRPLDCDDTDPAVFTQLIGYLDVDGDGHGAGPSVSFCTAGTLPANYAAAGDDCAPADPARWTQLLYAFRDADGDGAAIAETGTVCSGAALPVGYLTEAPAGRPLDCDDTNPDISIALTVFRDADQDGVGAGPGEVACTSGTPPAGFALSGTDCDDTDASVWASLVYTAVDFDGDGVTAPALGTRCTAGSLTPPYYAAPIGNDCDDTDPTLTHFSVLYPDRDGDGVGAPPRQVLCLGATTPPGFVSGGYDEDDGDPAVIETDDLDDLLDLVVLDG